MEADPRWEDIDPDFSQPIGQGAPYDSYPRLTVTVTVTTLTNLCLTSPVDRTPTSRHPHDADRNRTARRKAVFPITVRERSRQLAIDHPAFFRTRMSSRRNTPELPENATFDGDYSSIADALLNAGNKPQLDLASLVQRARARVHANPLAVTDHTPRPSNGSASPRSTRIARPTTPPADKVAQNSKPASATENKDGGAVNVPPNRTPAVDKMLGDSNPDINTTQTTAASLAPPPVLDPILAFLAPFTASGGRNDANILGYKLFPITNFPQLLQNLAKANIQPAAVYLLLHDNGVFIFPSRVGWLLVRNTNFPSRVWVFENLGTGEVAAGRIRHLGEGWAAVTRRNVQEDCLVDEELETKQTIAEEDAYLRKRYLSSMTRLLERG
ncbi:hypothetical protein Dda_8882 [Drechslerella dactyloides]|uniref:Uncharacterized protein n=1 Tax=Drechslerella dactyloides TaxID=74499 RepID=A0AAD6IQC1_DREDA|nr:hypothetical protein Dda_8882 [Drechslerella dactyloides]